MAELTYQQYIDNRTQVWQQMGFQQLPSQGADLVFRRRKFSIAKFGMVDTFCVVTQMEKEITSESVAGFGDNAFQVALKNKFFLPRGFGSAVVAYPLIVANSVSNSVRQFLTQSHTPKHYSSFEFPVIFDLSTQQLIFYEGTPAWGVAYYRGFRKEAERLFAP